MGLGVIWCDFVWQKGKKERKLIHILIPNSLTYAAADCICQFCFFPGFSFRLLLRSCCWESQWDWSVTLWQITTTPVGWFSCHLGICWYRVQGWHPRLERGITLHSLLSAARMAASDTELMWAVPSEASTAFYYKLGIFLPDWGCTETLHPCCCVVFYRFKTVLSIFFLLLNLNLICWSLLKLLFFIDCNLLAVRSSFSSM